MEDKKLVPKLRFPGFTDPWEQHKLGDKAKIIGGGTPSTKISEYWDGDINWYSPVGITSQIYVNESQRKITELGLKKSSARLLPIGTVLFTSRASIGNTAILGKEGCTNQGFRSIIPNKNELDSYFVYSITPQLKRYGETHGAGSTFVEVSGREMAKMLIKMPSYEEQQYLSYFFQKLDTLITLHQRKLSDLKKMKSGLLQKMFPKNGEDKPEIRFPEFTDAWEQHKLGDVAKKLDNLRIPIASSKRKKGSTPYYGANGIQDYVTGFTHDGENILIAEDGANNVHDYPIRFVEGKIWVNNHAHVLKSYKKYTDSRFLALALKKVKIAKYLVGGGRPKLNADTLMKILVKLPSPEEQIVIGNLFQAVDSLITLHQRKLKHLELQKKALLQQMFV